MPIDTFQKGETVICSITVKDAGGELQNAATSMKIEVYLKAPYSSFLAATSMDNDSTGTYHYDVNTSTFTGGTYKIIYTAVDGTRTSIETDEFILE